jgi:hypothetical protein
MLIAVSGLFIIVTPNWILPVCEGLLQLANGKEVPMRCFWTARSEMVIGALVFLSGLLLAYAEGAEAQRRVSNQVLFLGVATLAIPLALIPTCMNPDMACNVGTKPALLLLGGLTTLLGLVGSRAHDSETTYEGPSTLKT